MNLNIITVSTFYGCDKKGVELGPKALINNNLLSIIKNCGHTINEIIDIPVDIDNKNKFDNNKQIKYFDKVKTIVKNLSISIEESYKNNTFPLVLGGDHAISIGSLAGFSKSFKNTGVIWIDAHGDLNIPSSSPSYNAHGMPLALLKVRCHKSGLWIAPLPYTSRRSGNVTDYTLNTDSR